MRRQIFNTLALISLLLTITFFGLWICSRWRFESIGYAWPTRGAFVSSFDGLITYSFGTGVGYPGLPQELGWKYVVYREPEVSILRKRWPNHGNIAGVNVVFTRGYWEPSDEFGWYGESQFWSIFQRDKAPTSPLTPQNPSAAVFESSTQIIIPHWMHVLLASLLPAWWIRRTLRRRRLERIGKCTQCGYDLRGSPGRCPECGAMPREHIAI
jgi:hypothetical protein